MKETMDSFPAERGFEPGPFANRKLVRPSLGRNDHNNQGPAGERRGGGDRGGFGAKKSAPPEQTNAENFYYQKQMQSKTPMVIVLKDGEEVHGVIEWYDKNCLKVNRTGSPNLVVYKPSIKYMYKEGENINVKK